MVFDRRQFLQYSTACALLPSGIAFANEIVPTTPRLLVVMLRGACDTDSLLYQFNNSFYYDSRPTIAISRGGLIDDSLKVDDTWALHPSFSPLLPLLQKKQLAFVPFSGSDDKTRSHFEAQEYMEAGIPAGQKIASSSGWLNRVLVELRGNYSPKEEIGGTNFGRPSTLICRGQADIPDLQLQGRREGASELQRKSAMLMKLYEDAGYADRLTSVAERRIRLEQEKMLGSNHGAQVGAAENSVLAFRQIGRLMRQGRGFSVGFLDVNGWDTHVGQGADAGILANKFRQLATGLYSFTEELGPMAWPHTHVVVMSEFGRTFRENGNRGTDHGRGTTLMLLSGKPFGEAILGDQIEHTQKNLNENRDWSVLNNYRSVIAEKMLERMGLSNTSAAKIMKIT